MRPNDEVTYTDARGTQYPARVVAVTGSGPSGYKTLDLTYPVRLGRVEASHDVPYVTDKATGAGYWMFPGSAVAAEPLPAVVQAPPPTPSPAPVVDVLHFPSPDTE